MPRPPRPADLHDLRVPTDVRLSPDGRWIAFVVKESAPDRDGYRSSIWWAPADASEPARRVTLGARTDSCPRWSPDGRWLAFLSDRAAVLRAGDASPRADERSAPPGTGLRDAAGRDITRGSVQVWLLPIAGGEAHQLTRLPEDVADIAWSPDGRQLCLVSASRSAGTDDADGRGAASVPARGAGTGPARPDVRLIDELAYQLNGVGFTYDRPPKLWVVDVPGGEARRITSGRSRDEQPAWSPDGRHICFVSNRGRDHDLVWRSDIYMVPAQGGTPVRVSGGRQRVFRSPAWSPDGRSIAAIGHRIPGLARYRDDVWVFPADPLAEGRDLSGASDLFVAAAVNSDLVSLAEPRLAWLPDGGAVIFAAPSDGAYQLWQVGLRDGRVRQLTAGRHVLARPDVVPIGRRVRVAAIRLTATDTPDVVSFDLSASGASAQEPVDPAGMRRLSHLMAERWADIELVEPQERWHVSDGRRIQGWFLEAPRHGDRPAPVVVEIHGGPATLYGWSLMWEWQTLVASGVSVYAANPRGSQGYGQDFGAANLRDWGDGPMADLMAGLDSLVAEGLVDETRMGVTGGSYGGFLTAWIIGHSDRFAAAVACRGVYDMAAEMLSGDIGGPLFGRYEFGVNPWQDPELYRLASPITYAERMRTPLLIQHAEADLRCPITQAEELFAVLRSLRRPVRLMRTPAESHELTRSGTPFRRVENLERIRDWFVHYLVRGARALPRW